MKLIRTFLTTLVPGLFVASGGLAAPSALAAPTAVLLHPGGALVQHESVITPDADGALRLVLPPSADPRSLDLTVPGHSVASLRFEDSPALEASAVTALVARRDEARRELVNVSDALADLDARRAYWRQPPVRFSGLNPLNESLSELDDIMRRRLASFGQEEAELRQRGEELTRQIEFFTRRIAQAGGEAGDGAPLTRLAVVRLADSGAATDSGAEASAASAGKSGAAPLTVRYAYNLDNAGWRPLYRLEARPDAGRVDLSLEAELWQRSGEDWSGVPLVLSTADPRQGMTPPSLRPWIIRPRPAASPAPGVAPRAASQMLLTAAPEMAVDAVMDSSAAGAAPAAPLYLDGAAFASWDVGPRDVPAGSPLRLPLDHEELPAEFSYLLRPSLSAGAYMSARLDIPGPRYFPDGEALFVVDGVSVGRAPFSLSGGDSRIYFGRDPQVSAVMTRNSQQGGTQGILDRRQTYTWDWDIRVSNRHSRPVTVRVEETAPQSQDEQITVSVSSSPEARSEAHSLIWNLDVPAGESRNIRHTVSFSAPADMPVQPGR
ncbi:MAG: DUF4139 domain-containing protein [Desulfovibrionaceae bacterium]|nr:DUF4139 domain-containing protein [Desulfovibrionaceae bacterium]